MEPPLGHQLPLQVKEVPLSEGFLGATLLYAGSLGCLGHGRYVSGGAPQSEGLPASWPSDIQLCWLAQQWQGGTDPLETSR